MWRHVYWTGKSYWGDKPFPTFPQEISFNVLKANSLSTGSLHCAIMASVSDIYIYNFFFFFLREDAASGNHLFPFCNPPLHRTFTCPAKAIVKSFFFLLPLRSNISVVQSIVLDRQLLELELGHLVTDNIACLFNFLLCNGIALKWLIINHCGCVHHVSCQCRGEWCSACMCVYMCVSVWKRVW